MLIEIMRKILSTMDSMPMKVVSTQLVVIASGIALILNTFILFPYHLNMTMNQEALNIFGLRMI